MCTDRARDRVRRAHQEHSLISLLCPSRGRPQAAHDLLASFQKTRTTDAHLIFCLDADDPTLREYPEPQIIGAPTGDPTGPLNAAALASDADIVGFVGDDSRLETPGWDFMVEQSLRTPGFCWGDDGHDIPWPSTVFISREIVQALGYMVPPTLRRGFFDEVWTLLAEGTGTDRVIPAVFRHDNSAGDPKSPNFKPEAQVPPAVIAKDERAFNEWRRSQMASDIRKIRHLIYA